MLKYLLNFLLIFLMSASFSFAKDKEAADEAFLKKEFGQDLTHAPFFLRFSFYKKYNKDWKDAYYSERESFLKDYEINLAADQAKEKAEAQAQADKQKEWSSEKKAALRKETDGLKARLAEEKAEKEADEAQQKTFNSTISDQEKQLKQMQQEADQRREQEIAKQRQNSLINR